MTDHIFMSNGTKYTLVLISLAKRVLQGDMPPEARLKFLIRLEEQTDNVITPSVIAAVEPMCGKAQQLYMEIAKLDMRKYPGALDMLATKFDVFAALNPSLISAYTAEHPQWTTA